MCHSQSVDEEGPPCPGEFDPFSPVLERVDKDNGHVAYRDYDVEKAESEDELEGGGRVWEEMR